MKTKKKLQLAKSLVLISSVFLNFACASKTALVPGQEKIVIDNVYVEYSNIGDSYFKLEDYTNAAKYYKMSMQNPKIYWSSYYKLAKSYALASNWTEVLPMYKKLLKRDPENSSLKASLAYIYTMQGELEKARELYAQLLEIESQNEKYLENYISLLTVDEKTYTENTDLVNELLARLKENFLDNKNVTKFESAIAEFNKKAEAESGTEKEGADASPGVPESDSTPATTTEAKS